MKPYSKDQTLGGAILAFFIIIAAGYIAVVSIPPYQGLNATKVRLDAVLILVSIALIVILAIGAWTSYKMIFSVNVLIIPF